MIKEEHHLPAEQKSVHYLLSGTIRTAVFSISIGFLIVIYLSQSKVPLSYLWPWLVLVILFNVLRMGICHFFLQHDRYIKKRKLILTLYIVTSTIVGILWGLIYLISIPYVPNDVEIIVMLILGGMAAGAMGTLSAFLPAYFMFTLAMFIPVIIYNLMDDSGVHYFLVTAITIYALILFMQAHIIRNVLFKTYVLSFEKDALIQQLSKYVEKLKTLSVTDPLIGLYNRRFFDKTLKSEIHRTRRHKESLCLLILDVDKFKFINDHYGHPYGDKFLVYLADIMHSTFKRSCDMVFRIGGDEFAVILINQNQEALEDITLTLFDNLKKEKLPEHATRLDLDQLFEHVNLSIGGVSLSPEVQCTPEELFSKADNLLYQVKSDKEKQILFLSMSEECQ